MENAKKSPSSISIPSLNPWTGETIEDVLSTPLAEFPKIVTKARDAQKAWAQVRPRKRAKFLINLRETIINHLDELIELISKENGKPPLEALSMDLIPSIQLLSYFGKKGPRVLSHQPIRIHNPLLLHRKSYLNYWPLGLVAVISPWNYPFFLPIGDVAMALLAGNAVILKPSEVTPLVARKMKSLFDEAGFPPDLFQVVYGDGRQGEALIKQKPDKLFFTGSVATGRAVWELGAKNQVPVNLELGGNDAMIVLPDADLDFATSAALWGGFANSGQTCAGTERILVHESKAKNFSELLKKKIESLRAGKDADLGAITYEKQKKVYARQLKEAQKKNVQFLTGGEFSADQTRMIPTLVAGEEVETTDFYREETFGPVVTLSTYVSIDEAIKKANDSDYGLLASIITTNINLGEEVARQLEVGTVTINEVLYTASIPETPWGGVKASGIGRTHSDAGLLEFTHTRHIHLPRRSSLTFKSLWWFPYSSFQFDTFRWLVELYRKSWILKAKALPEFLWNLVQLIKNRRK